MTGKCGKCGHQVAGDDIQVSCGWWYEHIGCGGSVQIEMCCVPTPSLTAAFAAAKVTSVELLGGPHDGLVVSRADLHAPGDEWPPELRIASVRGSMIGRDGHIVAASALGRTDVYVRCGFARYRYKETRR